ncbi:MAG TPA: DNA repair protein RadC [Candidatus Pacearchaeota archaeon]|nr:DNA repair protein RadC [Candidatus Pacearchaeota archaeon]
MRIQDIPKQGRPRERFLEKGAEALSDAELFAIILRTGTVGENVVDVANRLINEYGLENLFECSLKELEKIKGIGPGKAMQILAIAELGKRYNRIKKEVIEKRSRITCARDVFNYFNEKLKEEKQEHFYVLLLNSQNYIIKEQLITKGILDASIIHPREIFKPAIKNSAAKIILVHNHPSGDPNPSEEDLEVTEKLVEAGKQIDINIIDHVIIGRDDWWDWRESKS